MTLRRIRIQGLGVIDDAELELTEGLNVITGETGAGKTMVVSGLGLLLGARADAGLVRSGARAAVVEGELDVPADHPAALRVQDAGGDASDGILLVRTVAAEGRSRAHVGGRAAPVAVLAEIGEHLVAVHGQADQWRLRDAEQHRLLLDAAGGEPVARAAAAYRQVYDEWQAESARLAELLQTSADRSMRIAMLRAALEEIEAVAPREGEEDELRAEAERLTHAEELRTAAGAAHDALVGGDIAEAQEQVGVTQLSGTASAAVATAADHDPELAALRQRLDEISYLASDLAADFSGYAAAVEVDPERLDAVHSRRATLSSLLRKYGPTSSDVLTFARSGSVELSELDVSDEQLTDLSERVEQLRLQVGRAGAALSLVREGVAEQVSRAVTEELAHLAMGSAEVTIHLGQRQRPPETDSVRPGVVPLPGRHSVQAWRHGVDEVEIRLAANPGAPARSVTKAASGGELSRVMLALELVCGTGGESSGTLGTVPTYVFDEVDAGVGGAAALDLGARLARLARTAQVIVVTHLGQVAAYADRHLVVRKSTDGQVTRSGVVPVEGNDRQTELARMLGGVADSDAALQHARELLARRGTMS